MKNYIISWCFQDETTTDAIKVAHEVARFVTEITNESITHVELGHPGKPEYLVFSDGEITLKKPG